MGVLRARDGLTWYDVGQSGVQGPAGEPGIEVGPTPPADTDQLWADTTTDGSGTYLDPFNVKSYGAVGDGVADDTVAVQAALTACGAQGGGQVVVPGPGTYKVSCLAIPSHVELVGVGGPTLLRGPGANSDIDGATVHNADVTAGNTVTTGNTHIAVVGIKFRSEPGCIGRHLGFRKVDFLQIRDVEVLSLGYDGVPPSFVCWATWFWDCNDVYVHNYFQDAGVELGEDGLHFEGGSRIIVSDCNIRSGDDCVAFVMEGSGKSNMADLLVDNCVLRSRKANAIKAVLGGAPPNSRISRVKFTNIVASSVPTDLAANGIYIANNQADAVIEDVVVSNVSVDGVGFWVGWNSPGCVLTGITHLVMSNVHMKGYGGDIFKVTNCPDAVFDHCVADTNDVVGYRGFWIHQSPGARLQHCEARNTAGHAYMFTTSDRVLLLDCLADTVGGHGFYTSTTNTTLIACRTRRTANSFVGDPGATTGSRWLACDFNSGVTLDWATPAVDDLGWIFQVLHVHGPFVHNGATAGFFGKAPVAKPTGVAVDAAGIHAALVALGLIGA